MQVLVEMKITVLDGDEKGREFTSKSVEETHTQFIDIGVLERVHLEWTHLHGMPTPVEVKGNICSCVGCKYVNSDGSKYPCSACDAYGMYEEEEDGI